MQLIGRGPNAIGKSRRDRLAGFFGHAGARAKEHNGTQDQVRDDDETK